MQLFTENLLILLATPLYMLVIGAEIFLSHYKELPYYSKKDTLTNAVFMLLNAGIDLAFRGMYLMVLAWVFQHKIFTWQSQVLYWLVLVLAEDFLFYWLHRMEHMVRLFWAVHVTHHSSEHFNLTVGFRSSVFQPLYRFVFFLPLAWLGFEPIDIIFVFAATQIWGILVHTRFVYKLGWLEYILVTPSHHRVHHANNPAYLDKNMGMFLIVWDKMFGTFQAELDDKSYQPIRYGLTKPLPSSQMGHQLLHEWKAIWSDVKRPLPWRLKIKYLLAPPGWSHDGSRKTSHQLREQEQEQQQQTWG
jgi:sterol desaturase/sphingolipid hydroxylase (fatty acid hydroxylase superfamily)